MRGPAAGRPGATATATLADLVEAQAARTPAAVAVVDGDTETTYEALDRRADRLAAELSRLGVGPDVPVGICTERCTALAVGLLAVLKAGGCCMPLDPSLPPHRLAEMLADAAPAVILTTAAAEERLPSFPARTVRLDPRATGLDRAEAEPRPQRSAGPDHLAYLLYTSGSTGGPKGVMLTHRGLVHHSLAVGPLYELGPGDRVLQFASIGFDVSIEEILTTWAHGGTVVLRPDDLPVLGPAWRDWVARSALSVLNLPAAHWHEWVHDLRAAGAAVPASVRLLVVGGERVLGTALAVWPQVGGDRVRWLNAYGPAETSVTATVFELPPGTPWPPDRDPPIGRPVPGTVLRILDEAGRSVPAGGAGDLHIGGPGLARGYLHRPELTAERFVEDPLVAGGRLYRSGDLVRALDDGNLEFLGRLDGQVKIRGFRVECGEVESVLSRAPGVAEAAVVAREDRPGDRRLVAYVVAAGGAGPAALELRRFAADRLPPHMVPSVFLGVDRLPITPNGKVARELLPAPDRTGRPAAEGAGLATPTEELVAGIWCRVLGLDAVAADDDFLELGGHSLQATQVVAALREALGVDLGVGALFEAPTVARLAALAESLRRRAAPAAPPLLPQPRRPRERIPLSLSQQQMWRLEAAADPRGLYNVTALHRFDRAADPDLLRRALLHVVDRHEALRTGFGVDSGEPYQVVAPSVAVALAVRDLGAVPAADRPAELQRLLAEQDADPIDPARPPLLRACLYRLGGGADLAAVTLDHLVCDGTSAYILLSELTAAYEALSGGAEPRLRPLAVQYADYALWQRRHLTADRLEAQLDYWRRKLAGVRPGPAVAFDHLPQVATRRIVALPATVAGDLYRGVRRLARATGSTVFVIVVAAVQALFSLGGDTDVVVSTTLSGRQRAETDGLIGCFHGVGRLRTDLSGDPTFETAVERARETVVGLLEHQDLPFFRIREAVLPPMPAGGVPFLAAVPTELQYFHTAHDEWAPGAGVVERPGPDPGPDRLFFRGHMHPLLVTLLDDGARLWGEFSYKVDFYDGETIERLARGLEQLLAAVVEHPAQRLSELRATVIPAP